MQRLDVSGAVRPIYGSLGVKRLILWKMSLLKAFLLYKCYVSIRQVLVFITVNISHNLKQYVSFFLDFTAIVTLALF